MLTGNGRAPKTQMQQAIRQELRLAEPPEPADVADALAVAICHYHLQVRRSLAAARPLRKAMPGVATRKSLSRRPATRFQTLCERIDR